MLDYTRAVNANKSGSEETRVEIYRASLIELVYADFINLHW